MPGVSGATVVTHARAYYTTRAAAGARASGIPHALRGGRFFAKLGRIAPRDREVAFGHYVVPAGLIEQAGS
jgi:hypothetical protein